MGVGIAGHAGCVTGGQASGSTAEVFGDGGEAHAASRAVAAAAMADNGRSRVATREGGVEWVFLEILAALAIAVAIVWWTLPKKRKPDDKGDPR